MTVTTVYSGAGDGSIDASDIVYATALSGSGMTASTTNEFDALGQLLDVVTYYIDELFLSFDTSAIPDTDVISDVAFDLYGNDDLSTTDFSMEVAAFDWSAGGLTTADWQDGTELDSLTVLASRSSAGWSVAGYNAFTNASGGAPFIAAINKTGTTYLVVFSAETRTNSAPTDSEYVKVWMGSEAQGGELRPRLTVTHAAAAGAAGPAFIGGGFF